MLLDFAAYFIAAELYDQEQIMEELLLELQHLQWLTYNRLNSIVQTRNSGPVE